MANRTFLTIGDINDRATLKYPAIVIEGHLVHVCAWEPGDWQVWVNTEAEEFDGLCVGSGDTRERALTQAVHALEAIVEYLQGPPPEVTDGAA